MAQVTGRTRKVPFCNHVDGVFVPGAVTEATNKSALSYAPLDDDVFAVAYPKSGTHWVCAIVGAIYNRGAPFASAVDYYNFGPFFQATGADGARCMKRPGILNLYTPFHRTPWSPRAKYIFVARNPKDICVSLYHYTKKFTEYKFEDGEFEDIFELFMEGKTIAGDYFEILLSWYERRNEPNVLFITYEQIKKNTKRAVLDIAEFLDPHYKADLVEDEKMLADVIHHSSIGFMKQLESKFIKELLSLPKESIPDSPALHMRLNTIRHNANADADGSTAAYMRKEMTAMEETKKHRTPFYNYVDGYPVPTFITDATWRSALNYAPRDDDVFVVDYPKCGMHWMKAIVGAIYGRGAPFPSAVEYYSFGPVLQATGAEGAHRMKRPGIIMLHLPFRLAPWSPKAKYIFVARNPKDCCVSLLYYSKMLSEHKFEDGDFDDMFETFMAGKAFMGDYFDTLLSWYERRNEPNVLFVVYERMKRDPRKAVLEIAEFLGPQYKKDLEDEKTLADVLHHSSMGFMKQLEAKFIKELLSLPKESIPDSPAFHMRLNTIRNNAKLDDQGQQNSTVAYMRKGMVGDWRNYFSPEQSKRMDDLFRMRTEGTELAILWKDYM